MPEPWIKVKVGTRRSAKLAALPSDSARLGYIYLLLEAKVQRDLGEFVNAAHIRDVLGRLGRYYPDFLRVGLVHEVPISCADCRKRHPGAKVGRVVVHDFRKEQRDPTNADRQEGWRNAPRNAGGNSRDNAPLTRRGDDGESDSDGDVEPLGAEEREARAAPREGSVDEVGEVMRWLGQHRAGLDESSKAFTELVRLVDQHQPAAVIAAMDGLGPMRDARQYVYGALKVLNPIPNPARNGTPRGHTRTAQEASDAFER